MPFVQIDLDAFDMIEVAAGQVGLDPDKLIGAMSRLWKFSWKTQQSDFSRAQLVSILKISDPNLLPALVENGFIDDLGETIRVRGTKRYKFNREAKVAAGKASAAKRTTAGRQQELNGREQPVEQPAIESIPKSLEIKKQRLLSTDVDPGSSFGLSDEEPKQEDPNPVVQRVFEHWRQTLGHPAAKLDRKRRQAITAALALGYTEQQLTIAIAGCASSPWHLGRNDRYTRYDALTLILRDAEQIDKFIGLRMTPDEQRQVFGGG